MAIAKPKNSNLFDDLVLNFDPFAMNELQDLGAPASTVQGGAAAAANGEEAPAAPAWGVALPPPDDAGLQDAPVSFFPLAALANADAGTPTVAGDLGLVPPSPAPQGPPVPIADADFAGVAAPAPDGPKPPVQDAGVASQIGALDFALGLAGLTAPAGQTFGAAVAALANAEAGPPTIAGDPGLVPPAPAPQGPPVPIADPNFAGPPPPPPDTGPKPTIQDSVGELDAGFNLPPGLTSGTVASSHFDDFFVI